ncbi:YceI family protein [Rhodobacteraceae bacterium NNCM2]|nr:YceI family protein [Coraliihabitans acroporae]
MKRIARTAVIAIGASLISSGAFAAGWTLSSDESKIAFGSVKKDTAGEVHHFETLSGSVDEDGAARVEIDVASVETWIDIRNERMREFVFEAVEFPLAVITATIDMAEVSALAPGETTVVSAKAVLALAGSEVPVEADLFVAALSADKVLVTTDEMIMLSTADLGVDAGVDELKKLAELPSITRVSPVTLRLVFTRD